MHTAMMGVRKGHSDPTFIKALVNGKVAPTPAVQRDDRNRGARRIAVIGDAGLIAPLARLTGKVTLITGAAGAITPVG